MKKFILPLMMLCSVCFLTAQDFDFPDDLNNEEASSEDGSFWDSDGISQGLNDLEIHGSLGIPLTTFIDMDDPAESEILWSGDLSLEFSYSSDKADLFSSVDISYMDEETSLDLSEAWMRIYMGQHDLELGFMKIVWGKGDGYHVMDPFNPMDYSQFIESDYNDRKMSELMARLNLITGEYGRLELVVVPWFTPDTQASSGSWMMAEALEIESGMENFVPTYALVYETAYAAANPFASASLATAQKMAAFQDDVIRSDTQKLSYVQWGLRYTQTLGPMDWGVSAARSYIRTPIANPVDLDGSALMSPAVLNIDPHYELMFTPMYMGAFEMAVSLWDLNIRHEAAVKLTEDLDGSKANIHNPRMEWLLGFDSNLPVSNLNINLQGAASYILFTEGITDSSDADYNADEYTHRIMGSISDSLFYDQLGLSLSGSYNIEDQDFMLIPEIEWNIKDSVTISTTYRLYSGKDDSLFGQFDQQDNLEILFDMSF